MSVRSRRESGNRYTHTDTKTHDVKTITPIADPGCNKTGTSQEQTSGFIPEYQCKLNGGAAPALPLV